MEDPVSNHWCLSNGFQQIVRQPTKKSSLLDLIIQDLHTCRAAVLPPIAETILFWALSSLQCRLPNPFCEKLGYFLLRTDPL